VVDAGGCPVAGIEKRGEDWVMPGEVLFDVDRAVLKPGAATALDWVAGRLREDPVLRLEIGGHCDASGTAEHNQRLSEQRAEAARTYLVAKGVNATRLVAKGYGFSSPVAPNDSAANRARNRRVELKPIHDEAAPPAPAPPPASPSPPAPKLKPRPHKTTT
jgi:outer membrane protein OmpA-like peptidoglycan-associated protein